MLCSTAPPPASNSRAVRTASIGLVLFGGSPSFNGRLALPKSAVLEWVRADAQAVAVYYGSFPVRDLGLLLTPAAGNKISQGVTFGDGTPIPDEDMDQVREAIWKNMVFFKWRRGDVLIIDNDAVAHGRMPYRGPRAVAVCWA